MDLYFVSFSALQKKNVGSAFFKHSRSYKRALKSKIRRQPVEIKNA